MNGSILLYHGVTDSISEGIENYSAKHILKNDFVKQMRFLQENMNPVSLRYLDSLLQKGEPLPDKTVAITFDDSFLNVKEVAFPILREFEIPATFFISVGFIGTSKVYWQDRIEHAVNTTSKKSLEVEFPDGKKYFRLDSSPNRIACVSEIKRILKQTPKEKRYPVVDSVEKMAAPTKAIEDVSNYRNLPWEDVRELDKYDGYEVGGHTVNHEILALLCRDDCEYEIKHCIQTLHEKLGHSIDLFSYPEGQEVHFGERDIEVLKIEGIVLCPTAISGFNTGRVDSFHLKRTMVGFMGQEFPLWRV